VTVNRSVVVLTDRCRGRSSGHLRDSAAAAAAGLAETATGKQVDAYCVDHDDNDDLMRAPRHPVCRWHVTSSSSSRVCSQVSSSSHLLTSSLRHHCSVATAVLRRCNYIDSILLSL